MYLHEINEQVHDKIVGFNSEKCLPDNVKTVPIHSDRTGSQDTNLRGNRTYKETACPHEVGGF